MRAGRHSITALFGIGLCLSAGTSGSAEVRGVVTLQQTAAFGAQVEPLRLPVSVALFPLEGQRLPARPPARHDIILHGNALRPLYLVLQRGDRLRFRSEDGLYHELFSRAPHARRGESLELRLGPAATGREASLIMNEAADWHWFCRIHARSYARVDVVDTPLVRMVGSGEPFEFGGLPPGKWRLRVAAPGAETRHLEVRAMTVPPPLDVRLSVKGFTPSTGAPQPPPGVEQLYPGRPGT